MTDSLKLLAIFPHPDDETLGLGSTFARYSAEGIETYLVCATRGAAGSIQRGLTPAWKELPESAKWSCVVRQSIWVSMK